MADVNINKFRASVVRDGSKPASPGFIVSEGQDPVDPAGNGQNHLPVTIATAATGLSITDSQVLGGAGTVGQYIRGDGSLADFPQASGGGSSVNYYLNGSISQGTIGGVAYKELNKVPILGAGTDFTINADGYIASFLTDAGDPNLLEIPGGNWNFETYFSASSSGGTPTFYVELYKYDGTTFTLIASSSSSPELIAFGTNLNPYFSTLAVPTTTLALTDRLAIRYYVTHSGRTITLHTENNHLCQVVTTFTTGLTSLNGLTAQVQNLAVGTSGTDFNIASATATHTFNLPTASATNRGALSSADWTTFNNKQNALGYVPVPETRTITINGVSQDLSANRTYNVGTVTSVGLSSATSGVTIGGSPVTGVGAFTLAIATASGSQNGLLSSTDWTTFNNKQNALTNPVTGTGTTNYLPKFTGSTTIGNSNIQDNGSLVSVGVAANFSSSVTSLSLDVISASGVGSSAATGLARFITAGTSNGIAVGQSNSSRYTAILANEHIIYNDDFFMRTNGNFPLSIGTNNTTNLRVFSDGNVLIQTGGTFTNNGARLQVSGTSRFSGNVGIGVAPSSDALNVTGIDYNNSGYFLGGSTTGASYGIQVRAGSNSTDYSLLVQSRSGSDYFRVRGDGAATFSSSVTATGDIRSNAIFRDYQGEALIQTSGSDTQVGSFGASTPRTISLIAGNNRRLFITTSGNVEIGTTGFSSPSGADRFVGVYGAQDCSLILEDANQLWELYVNDDFYINRGSTNVLSLNRTSGAAIFSSVVVSPIFSGENTTSSSANLQSWNKATTGDNKFVEFYTEGGGGTLRGSIDYNRGAGLVRYNTTSDANLKNIIGDSDKQKSVNILKLIRIREYSWKDDKLNKTQIGVIAQELYNTYKGAVSVGSEYELLGTENYKPWAVDKTAFTFHLIAGWQEHERIIRELKAEIDTLKN